MPNQRRQPARLASLPGHVCEHPLIDLRSEVDRAFKDLETAWNGADPAEVSRAEGQAHSLGWFILWICAGMAGKAYGSEVESVLRQWAKALREAANGLSFPDVPRPDKADLILENLENLQRQVSRWGTDKRAGRKVAA